jgi:hypothetical protein
MWIRLNATKNIVVHGTMTHYKKGDWVNVGKQMAREWIAAGDAFTVDPEQMGTAEVSTSGIAIRGHLAEEQRSKLEQVAGLKLAFFENDWTPQLPFTETMIWSTQLDLRLDLIMTGFNLLKKGWQVVVPLYDYTTLAKDIGTPADRDATQAVIRDLRVPVRDTRLMFVRRCDDTRRMMTVWGEALKTGCEERLAYMQAVYTVKPLVCDVPASWAGRDL